MSNPSLSSTSVCNSALLKVGADLISSLTDGSRAANICDTLYVVIRDKVMGDAPWRNSVLQVQLIATGTVPLFTYQYSFQIPNDCLRVLTVDDTTWTVVSGGLIYCNNPGPLNVTYIQRNTDESSWDERLAEAVSLAMAREIALALVQSVPLAQQMDKMYQQAIKDARALNAVVGSPKHLIADIWSGARKGMGFGSLGPVYGELSEPYNP